MQSRFTVTILVLQAEGLVCAIRYLGFLFQTASKGRVRSGWRVYPVSGGLKVCAGLRLALNVQAAFEPFWDFEMQPALFQVADEAT